MSIRKAFLCIRKTGTSFNGVRHRFFPQKCHLNMFLDPLNSNPASVFLIWGFCTGYVNFYHPIVNFFKMSFYCVKRNFFDFWSESDTHFLVFRFEAAVPRYVNFNQDLKKISQNKTKRIYGTSTNIRHKNIRHKHFDWLYIMDGLFRQNSWARGETIIHAFVKILQEKYCQWDYIHYQFLSVFL